MNILRKEKLLRQDLIFIFYDNCNNNFLYVRPIACYLDKNKHKKSPSGHPKGLFISLSGFYSKRHFSIAAFTKDTNNG